MSTQPDRRHFLKNAASAAAIACVGARQPSSAESGEAAVPPSQLTDWLKRPILKSRTTMKEMQDAIESGVVAMPPLAGTAEWERTAQKLRSDVLEKVVFRGVPDEWRHGPTKVEWLETIAGGPGYHIRKVRYEALPGYWIPGLLYTPDHLSGQVPVVYNVHGHVGEGGGKAKRYVQLRCINLAKRGMLAFTSDWPDIGQLSVPGRHYRMHQLELCGVSGVAPFYLCLSKALDLILELPQVDPTRVGVTGLSGGGWQTIFISSLDTRVTLANPVAGHSSFRTRARHPSDLGDGEQSPPDLATIADYCHLTAMMAPRPLQLTHNAKDDCCFNTAHALPPLLEAAQPVYNMYGKSDNLRSYNNADPGPEPRGHNYGQENREAFYAFIGDFFFPSDDSFARKEIPSEDEVKTYDELLVPLPSPNLTFNSMALKAMSGLPKVSPKPSIAQDRTEWRANQRKQLAQLLRTKKFQSSAEQVTLKQLDYATARFWRIRLNDEWTTGVVDLRSSQVKPSAETFIVIADRGRHRIADEVSQLLQQGHRVLAVDLLSFGESGVPANGHLFSIQLSAAGMRLLGLQTSQLAAIARWARDASLPQPVQVLAIGPRTSVIATAAAAVEEDAIGGLVLRKPLNSLSSLIKHDGLPQSQPELFCFGLLKSFDVPQLRELVSPRPVTIET